MLCAASGSKYPDLAIAISTLKFITDDTIFKLPLSVLESLVWRRLNGVARPLNTCARFNFQGPASGHGLALVLTKSWVATESQLESRVANLGPLFFVGGGKIGLATRNYGYIVY